MDNPIDAYSISPIPSELIYIMFLRNSVTGEIVSDDLIDGTNYLIRKNTNDKEDIFKTSWFLWNE